MDNLVKSESISLKEHIFTPICSHLLKICYSIAVIDLIQSFYFLVQSFILLATNVNLYSIIAFLGSIFWIFMVGLLFMGLWKSRLPFIIAWLCFSIVGVILDVFFFMWTISISDYITWMEIIQFTFLYVGIVIEWLCIYMVYKYCLSMKSTSTINVPEDGHIRGSQLNRSSERLSIDQSRRGKSMSSKLESIDQIEKIRLSKTESIAEPEQGKDQRNSQLETSDKSGRASKSQKPKEKDLNQSKKNDKAIKRKRKQKTDNENKKSRSSEK
ncbi:uncharacterized protein LOC133842131 isoform X1 [Drosophila sulfurigaster albostrigata]|uniref:uncharacterized protein LOC133842131 isoform X1 n=1 Tax=Drosophila sulfurigaster albostrigata TaxID=89887 RepID=UPI002D219EAE|nr:uncharacterized protein LOC133842131 isoform X1 [Drosophila sulfurigaster albostrigata]